MFIVDSCCSEEFRKVLEIKGTKAWNLVKREEMMVEQWLVVVGENKRGGNKVWKMYHNIMK